MMYIATESGKYYKVNDNLELCQEKENESGYYGFSPSWKLIGFRRILPFRNLGVLISPLRMLDVDMRYKNGKGMYVLVDYDHGTYRDWGDHICGFFHTND